MKNSIVKCSHCGLMLSSENYDTHKCDLPLKECKTIEVVKIIDGSYEDRQLMNGWGTDGVLYTFEVVPRKAIPIMMPLKQTKFDMNPKNRRGLYRTLNG